MAEPLGVAASAIQVAGAGLKLAETLKTYIDSVRKAEKQLKPIADHVKLTSDVLTNIGSLLKNDDIRSLYTKELLASTNNALGGCRTAFEDLEKFISKMLKPNDVGKVSIQTTARFTLYFKQKELDILQAHLERFKSSLDLVLGVLNLASSAKSARDTSAIAEMKLDIKRLIQAEHDAKRKEAALVSSPPEKSREVSRDLPSQDQPSTARELPMFTALNAMVHVETGIRGLHRIPDQASAPRDSPELGSTAEDTVLGYLKQCADAAARLTADIEQAISKWNESHEYQPKCLVPAFQGTATAMDRLSNYEESCNRDTPPPYAEGTCLRMRRGEGTRSTTTTTTTTQISRWDESTNPTYPKIHLEYLSVDTLRHFELPWEYDMYDRNYIIIKREMDQYETDVLFDHTRRLRAKGGVLLLEPPKEAKQYAWYRKRDRSPSRVRKFGILELESQTASADSGENTTITHDYRSRNSSGDSRDGRRRRMSRSRSRSRSRSECRRQVADLPGDAVVGSLERARSRSRERSKSRVRQSIPVVSAGLVSAAIAGLWEKNKANEGAKPGGVLEEQQGERFAQPGLSRVAAAGIAGAAAAYGVNTTVYRDEERDYDCERTSLRPEAHSDGLARHNYDRRFEDPDRGLGFAFEHPPEPPRSASAPPVRDQPGAQPRHLPRQHTEERDHTRQHHEDWAPSIIPPIAVDLDEDYRRRMEQIQLGLGSNDRHTELDPERERRRQERERRHRERSMRNDGVASAVSATREREVAERRDVTIRKKKVAKAKGRENKAWNEAAARQARADRAYRGQSQQDDKVTSPTSKSGRGARRPSRQQDGRKPVSMENGDASTYDSAAWSYEAAQIIDNSPSERRENRVKISILPIEGVVPKGILKRPNEKFPEDPKRLIERVTGALPSRSQIKEKQVQGNNVDRENLEKFKEDYIEWTEFLIKQRQKQRVESGKQREEEKAPEAKGQKSPGVRHFSEGVKTTRRQKKRVDTKISSERVRGHVEGAEDLRKVPFPSTTGDRMLRGGSALLTPAMPLGDDDGLSFMHRRAPSPPVLEQLWEMSYADFSGHVQSSEDQMMYDDFDDLHSAIKSSNVQGQSSSLTGSTDISNALANPSNRSSVTSPMLHPTDSTSNYFGVQLNTARDQWTGDSQTTRFDQEPSLAPVQSSRQATDKINGTESPYMRTQSVRPYPAINGQLQPPEFDIYWTPPQDMRTFAKAPSREVNTPQSNDGDEADVDSSAVDNLLRTWTTLDIC